LGSGVTFCVGSANRMECEICNLARLCCVENDSENYIQSSVLCCFSTVHMLMHDCAFIFWSVDLCQVVFPCKYKPVSSLFSTAATEFTSPVLRHSILFQSCIYWINLDFIPPSSCQWFYMVAMPSHKV